MDDYIKREEAIKICNMPNYNIHDILFALKTIPGKMIPAADVRENVRGRWKEKIIGNPAGGGTLCVSICVCCGVKVYATAVKGDLNYCPNCGADMRQRDNE